MWDDEAVSATAPFARRTFGVLLHPSSLPGPEPIGTFGDEAEDFVDWLATTGAGVWQVLPLTLTHADGSPYFSPSAFAPNPWLIDLRRLAAIGLLTPDELEAGTSGATERVDHVAVVERKRPLLWAAADRFLTADHPLAEPFADWRDGAAEWLDDTCHFLARKDAEPDTAWWDWPDDLRTRRPAALSASAAELADEIARWSAVLFLADHQWQQLRRRANDVGIAVLGDIPIYVAPDSADVWMHQDSFELDDAGRLTAQSGCPPDYFSETGQLWGNPIYDWAAMESDGFTWWLSRLRRTLELTDLVRIDHFRGLSAYWSVPADDTTAIDGTWEPGPGQAFVDAVRAAFPDLPIVAEDLGELDDEVLALRDDNDLVGMRVLQFGFDDRPPNEHHPSQLVERSIVYTGTHDNDTLAGWWTGRSRRAKERVRLATDMPPRIGTRKVVWWLIETALRAPSVAAVVPAQDLLALGNDARMNLPGTTEGNWGWRLDAGALTPVVAARLREAASTAGGRGIPRS